MSRYWLTAAGRPADFYYMDAYSLPRFGPGAFLQLLELLYHRASGRKLEVRRHGKPNAPAYVCAAHKLARQLGRPDAALQHIYAIGCVCKCPVFVCKEVTYRRHIRSPVCTNWKSMQAG